MKTKSKKTEKKTKTTKKESVLAKPSGIPAGLVPFPSGKAHRDFQMANIAGAAQQSLAVHEVLVRMGKELYEKTTADELVPDFVKIPLRDLSRLSDAAQKAIVILESRDSNRTKSIVQRALVKNKSKLSAEELAAIMDEIEVNLEKMRTSKDTALSGYSD